MDRLGVRSFCVQQLQQQQLQQQQLHQQQQQQQPASTPGLYSVTVPPGPPHARSALCVDAQHSRRFGLHPHYLIGTVAALRRLWPWKQNECQRARQRPNASDRPSRQSVLSSNAPAARHFACSGHAAHHSAPTGGGTCNMRHAARRSQCHSTGGCDLAVGGCPAVHAA